MAKKASVRTSKKAPKRNASKKLIFLFIFVLIAAAIIAFGIHSEMNRGISKVDTSINYEDTLFNEASLNANMSFSPYYGVSLKSVEFDPSFSDLGLYTIRLDGYPMNDFNLESCPLWGDDNDLEEINQQTLFKDFSKKHLKIIESSRQHVIEYINDSDVFTNKDELIEGIKNVKFYLYTKSTHEQLQNAEVSALHLGDGIYCNKKQMDFFCEYVVVHELVHHLRYLASDRKLSNELYFATSFDETITDLITLSMDPANTFKPGYGSPYYVYYGPVYKYLNLFGRDALSAYFYGYDEFFEENGGNTFKLEHNAYVVTLAYYNMASDGVICNEGIYNAWDARF